jgi:intracellular multiplication protein IcmT
MWRNTMLPVRAYIVDARALVPLMIFLMHWSWTTLYVALVGIALFGTLEFCGLSFPAAIRTLRRWIVGPIRPAVPAWKKRRFS